MTRILFKAMLSVPSEIARMQAFLDHFAETCDLEASAAAAGFR
jgi:hypothetical protein